MNASNSFNTSPEFELAAKHPSFENNIVYLHTRVDRPVSISPRGPSFERSPPSTPCTRRTDPVSVVTPERNLTSNTRWLMAELDRQVASLDEFKCHQQAKESCISFLEEEEAWDLEPIPLEDCDEVHDFQSLRSFGQNESYHTQDSQYCQIDGLNGFADEESCEFNSQDTFACDDREQWIYNERIKQQHAAAMNYYLTHTPNMPPASIEKEDSQDFDDNLMADIVQSVLNEKNMMDFDAW